MRKFTFSLLVAFIAISAANAQIKAGTNVMGGSIYYSSQKTELNNANVGQVTKNSSFGIIPSYGKAIRENLVVGADLSYTNTVQENTNGNSNSTKTKNNSFGAGVFVRPYKNLGTSGFYLFLQGRLGADFSKEKLGSNNNESTGFNIGVGINPGIAYAVTPKMHIETGLNNLFYTGYSSNKSTNDPISYSYKTSGFNASIGLGNSTQWTVGVKFLLGT
jgi:hypothetical protein